MKTIEKLPEASGVAYLPGDRLAVTSASDGIVQMVDTRSYSKDAKVSVGADADNVRAETTADGATRLWVGWGEGALALVDPAADKPRKMTDVKLDGHPESFQLETKGRRIFVNVPKAGNIAVVDREARAVVAKWKVSAGANFPMALDEPARRLYVGCRQPAKLLVYDTKTGKELAAAECSGDTDDVFFDASSKRVYLSCGEGVLDVFDASETAPKRIGKIATAPGARTCLFVADLGKIFLAVPHRGSQQAEVRVYKTK